MTYIYVYRALRLKVGGLTANASTYNNYRESSARAARVSQTEERDGARVGAASKLATTE